MIKENSISTDTSNGNIWMYGGDNRTTQDLWTHLLAEPLGIGPGQRFRRPADGQFFAIAVCHKHSPWNILAQCLLTHPIWTHSLTGNWMNISIRRCSGSLPIGPSPLSVIRLGCKKRINRRCFHIYFSTNKFKTIALQIIIFTLVPIHNCCKKTNKCCKI
jgi:hypothetical protein